METIDKKYKKNLEEIVIDKDLSNKDESLYRVVEGENLVKKACYELDVIQKKLSENTGFTPSTISQWKKGKKLPRYGRALLNLLIKVNRLEKIIKKD